MDCLCSAMITGTSSVNLFLPLTAHHRGVKVNAYTPKTTHLRRSYNSSEQGEADGCVFVSVCQTKTECAAIVSSFCACFQTYLCMGDSALVSVKFKIILLIFLLISHPCFHSRRTHCPNEGENEKDNVG